MRHINFKFLICLVVAIALVAAGVHLLWAINVGRSTRVVLNQAESALRAEKPREALKHYAVYLNRNPDDGEVVCQAATIAADLSETDKASVYDIRRAYQWMERALRQVSDNHDIRRRLVDLLLKVGGFNEARKHIELLEDAGQSDPELDYLYARCAVIGGDEQIAIRRLAGLIGYDSALEKVDRRRATAPEKIEAYVLLAEILQLRRDNPRLADLVIDQMVSANPDSAEALLGRGRYLRQHNSRGTRAARDARLERAHADLRNAVLIDPDGVELLLENAALAIDGNDYAAAGRYLDRAESLYPQDRRVYMFQARVATSQGKHANSVARFQAGLKQLPDDPELTMRLFEAQLQSGDLDAAQATIRTMKQLKFPSERIELAEAQIPLVQNDWQEARRRLEEIRPQVAPHASLARSVDLLLGQCYERLGLPDLQLETYGRVLAAEPTSQPALEGRVLALAKLGQFEKAFDGFRDLRRMKGEEEFDKNPRLVRSYKHIVKVLKQRNPGDARFQRVLDQVDAEITQAAPTTDLDAAVAKLAELVQAEQYAAAQPLLAENLKSHPDDERLQRLAIQLILRQKGPQAALNLLDKAQRSRTHGWKDTAYFRLVRAELLARIGGAAARDKISDLQRDLDKFSVTEQAQIWRGLGSAYYNLRPRDYEAVQRCFDRAAELAPDDPQLLELQFQLAQESGDDVGMMALLDSAASRSGKGSALWSYFQARWLVWQVDQGQKDSTALAEAARLVEQVAKSRPNWHAQVQLNAKINDLQGDVNSAIDLYQRSLKLGPPSVGTVRRLVELLMAQGRNEEARTALGVLGNVPAGLQRHHAVLEALSGDRQKAMAALADAVPEDSTSAADFIWKGQVLNRLEMPREAEHAFRRAVKLGPDVPTTWLVLVEHLVRNGKAAAAESMIRQAENHLSESQAPLLMAQSYAMLGSYDMAENYYHAALASRPDDLNLVRAVAAYYMNTKQHGKARRHLSKILRSGDAASSADSPMASWARRSLAAILAAGRDYPSFRTAMALLDANRVDGALSVADRQLKARLMAERAEPVYRRQALDLFEQLRLETTLTAEDRLQLARFYNQVDRWRDCQELMMQLVADTKGNVAVLSTLSDMLIDHKEAEQAAQWVQRVAASDPSSWNSVRLLARLHLARGESDKAVARIEARIPKRPKREDAGLLLTAGRLCEQLKLYDAAEQYYRRLTELEPARQFGLAAYLARRGSIDEALQICAEAKAKETILAVCSVGEIAVSQNSSNLTPDQIRQVGQWLEEGRRWLPDSVELKIQHASYLDNTGRSGEAIGILEEVLSGNLPDGQRGQIANNLAFMRLVQGDHGDAVVRMIDQAIALLGPQIELLDTRALAHVERGECKKAINDLEEVTAFGVNNGIYHFHLAMAHQCAGDRSAARRELRSAKEMGLSAASLSAPERERLTALERWLTS